jgi:hypothetical protein
MPATTKISAELYRIHLIPSSRRTSRRALVCDVTTALRRGVRDIVVDCSEWRELDLIVLSSLVGCSSRCVEKRVKFNLENLENGVRDAIERLNLGHRVGVLP